MLCFLFEKNNLFVTFTKFSMFMGKKRKFLRYCRNYLRLHFIIIIKTLYYHHYYYSHSQSKTTTSTSTTNNSNLIVIKSLRFLCCNNFNNNNNLLTIYRILYLYCFKNYKKILKPSTFRWSQINKQIWNENIKELCVYRKPN